MKAKLMAAVMMMAMMTTTAMAQEQGRGKSGEQGKQQIRKEVRMMPKQQKKFEGAKKVEMRRKIDKKMMDKRMMDQRFAQARHGRHFHGAPRGGKVVIIYM